MCRAKKIFFHTDAAQAVGKIPLNVNEMNIDLMSISGHKIYGPKGKALVYNLLTLAKGAFAKCILRQHNNFNLLAALVLGQLLLRALR